MDMHDDQSGSESQGPRYVGPWSTPAEAAAEPTEPSQAGTPSPDVAPGQPGETTPLIMPAGAAGPPGPAGQPGFGQPGGYAQPGGHSRPETSGPPGGYRPPRGYAQPGGYGPP